MRQRTHMLLLLASGLALAGCQPAADPEAELAKTDKVIRSYFDGAGGYDYEAMRQACTEHFVIIEEGQVWSVEDHINLLKPYEGNASISYVFSDVKRYIDGAVSWRTYRNDARVVANGDTIHFDLIESAVFHRVDGEWKLALITAMPAGTSAVSPD